jgi:DNA-binding transcriptional regulator YdaS (Cro superfamily)
MDKTLNRYEALVACLDKAGSVAALARDLKLSQPTVWRWVHQTRRMPAEYVLTAETLYGVSRHHLRPDIYPREIPQDRRTGSRDRRFYGVDQSATTQAA